MSKTWNKFYIKSMGEEVSKDEAILFIDNARTKNIPEVNILSLIDVIVSIGKRQSLLRLLL